MGIGRRCTDLALHVGVQAPRHAGAAQPAFQRIAAARVDREAPCHRGYIEKIQHLADREAALGQIQHLREGAHQGVHAGKSDVGQMPGDVQGDAAVVRGFAEHGSQVRRIRADVRRHHHDVAMLQGGIVGQAAQQGILQHFQFAQAGVAGVHAQAGIIAQDGQERFQLGATGNLLAQRGTHQLRLQAADAGLQLRQQRSCAGQRFGIVERVALVDGVACVQGEAEILRDAAERHQQRVPDFVIQRVRIVFLFQQETLLAQVDPVLAARVRKVQVHGRMQRRGLQGLQHVGRQMADAEHVQRDVVRRVACAAQGIEQGRAALGAVRPVDG